MLDHLLIFEPDSSGHRPLGIRLLYNYILENRVAMKVSFVVHPETPKRMQEEDNIQLCAIEGKVDIILLEGKDISARLHSTLWVRALTDWRLMKKYLVPELKLRFLRDRKRS